MFNTLFLAPSIVRPQTTTIETWLPVPGWSNYQVSDLGNVRHIDRVKDGQIIEGKMLAAPVGKYLGRRTVLLCQNRTKKSCYVYRLVALAFLPNPENKPCINHKDGNKANDCLENLEWCTYAENMEHAKINGLLGKRGAGLPLDDILAIQELRAAGAKVCDLAQIFRVNRVTIWNNTRKRA